MFMMITLPLKVDSSSKSRHVGDVVVGTSNVFVSIFTLVHTMWLFPQACLLCFPKDRRVGNGIGHDEDPSKDHFDNANHDFFHRRSEDLDHHPTVNSSGDKHEGNGDRMGKLAKPPAALEPFPSRAALLPQDVSASAEEGGGSGAVDPKLVGIQMGSYQPPRRVSASGVHKRVSGSGGQLS